MNQSIVFSVTDFVAVFNQTLEFAYPVVTIEGELSSFRVSKNRWVYFDLKDETSNVKFFGSLFNLPGPLEDGMKLRVSGSPRLHPNYGFSINVSSISLAGEGTIKKANQLLEAKLKKEGLFASERKRLIPYPPQHIGLIASGESAAFSDFLKVLNARWGGLEIDHYDVQVQGEEAVNQLVSAINYFNSHSQPPEVLVITRGGGSLDDLQAFSSELVVRAVAGSRIPTMIAIGHERDVSLAEMAADVHASTPSNAAELLVPSRDDQLARLSSADENIRRQLSDNLKLYRERITVSKKQLDETMHHFITQKKQYLNTINLTLEQINPQRVLARGYAIVRKQGRNVKHKTTVGHGDNVTIEFSDGSVKAEVQ